LPFLFLPHGILRTRALSHDSANFLIDCIAMVAGRTSEAEARAVLKAAQEKAAREENQLEADARAAWMPKLRIYRTFYSVDFPVVRKL